MEKKLIYIVVAVIVLAGGVWFYKKNLQSVVDPAAAKKQAASDTNYGTDGYNAAGYNKDGYNKDGINQKTGRTVDGFDTSGFNELGLDRNGYNKDGYKDGKNIYGYNAAQVMMNTLSQTQKDWAMNIAQLAKNDLILPLFGAHNMGIYDEIKAFTDAQLVYFLLVAYPYYDTDKNHSFSERLNNQPDGWNALNNASLHGGWTKSQALQRVSEINSAIVRVAKSAQI